MATFFSDTNVGTWDGYTMTGTLTGTVTRSGNTVTLSGMSIALRVPAGQAWGDDNWSFTVNGTSTSFHVYAQGDGYSLGSYSLNNTSFNASASQTSATIGWSSSDGVSGTFTITFPAGSTVPSGLAATNITPLTNGFSATVSVTDWGTGGSSDPDAHYKELSVFTYGNLDQSPARKNRVTGTSLSDTITTDNSSSWIGSLVMEPNTRYTLGVYATNGNDPQHGQTGIGDYVTLAEAPTVSLDSVTDTTVTISYSAAADGGFYDKTVEYSLDGGTTWSTGATITGGSASSGTFTITGLSAGTTYSIQTRTTTTSGSFTGSTISATTTGSAGPKLYGPVSDGQGGYETKLVEKLYAPVSDGQGGYVTKKITKLYGAVAEQGTVGVTGTIRSGGAGNATAFDGDTFWAKFITSSAYDINKTVSYISLPSPAGTPLTTFADIFYTDSTYKRLSTVTAAALAEYGITYASSPVPGSDYIDLTPISGTVYATKLIYEDI